MYTKDTKEYSQRLGTISDAQFQAAFDRFNLGSFFDRLILCEYFQRNGQRWWKAGWTFRDWAGRYTSFEGIQSYGADRNVL